MEKKIKFNYLTVIAGVVLISLICLMFYIAQEYYAISSLQKQYRQNQAANEYSFHCAFIADSDTDFWDSAYEAAREEGIPNGIYVENFGKDLDISHTTNELLKMAIAANVDAIIMEADDSYPTTLLMNRAVNAGIAVSTIYRDNMGSDRYSYTGVNNVTLGYDYGSLALKYADSSDCNVMVFLDDREQDAESRLLISGIGKALEEQRSDMKLDTMKLNSSSTFEVEEAIRGFLKNNHDSTDIIICTSLQQTQFASQIAVDMNYVGDFKIIGSYQNHAVLESLANGVICASIVIDADQMGKRAVENLAEYLEYGHTSDYSQTDVHTLEQEDALRALEAIHVSETPESESSGEGESS